MRKHPAMAPKRASSKATASIDDVAKVAHLAKKKGKALADHTLQEAFKDDAINSKSNARITPPPMALCALAVLRAHRDHPHQASLLQKAKTP